MLVECPYYSYTMDSLFRFSSFGLLVVLLTMVLITQSLKFSGWPTLGTYIVGTYSFSAEGDYFYNPNLVLLQSYIPNQSWPYTNLNEVHSAETAVCACTHSTEVNHLINSCQSAMLENFWGSVAAADKQCILTAAGPTVRFHLICVDLWGICSTGGGTKKN